MSSVERAFNSFIVSAADIEPAEHEFLLEDKRFPIGEVSIIAGAGGAGKGQLACAHISYTSMGCNLDGDRAGEPKKCLFISAEDTAGDIRRRLDRSLFKADMSKVFILDKLDSYDFGIDLSDEDNPYKLDALINVTGASLIYLDPLQAFVGESTDLSRQNHVRHVMHTLAALAERTHTCVVLLMHLNKRQSIANATDLLCGSSDIVNAARSVLLLTNDFKGGDPDRRFLFHIKANHARKAPTLEMSISARGNQIVGKSEVSADDYVLAVNSRRLAKSSGKAAPNYDRLFLEGCKDMICKGKFQSSFKDFLATYAPDFSGKPRCVLGDISEALESSTGFFVQTQAGKSEVRIDGQRGFKLVCP